MPGFDATGPQGLGRMTGRRFGPCGVGQGARMGFGRFHAFGRGLGKYFGWNVPQTKDEKVQDARAYLESLQEEIEAAKQELADLQKSE